jgi:hypothetical protein
MKIQNLVDQILYFWFRANKLEAKFHRCQNYREQSIIRWKKQSKLSWKTTMKILENLEIFDGMKVREIVSRIVKNNIHIFSRKNCYITAFGKEGKSGGVICYDVLHTGIIKEENFKRGWDIPSLPPNSTIVFVEDLIGTGTQSVKYINQTINPFLNASFEAILLTVCATSDGIDNVVENTNFSVLTGIVLEEENYQVYSPKNNIFTLEEKNLIRNLNNKLLNPTKEDYDCGVLVAFYYGIPNSTLPILWKEGYPYINDEGIKEKWFALLPRRF